MRRSGYIRNTSKDGGWTCSCGENFRTRKELSEHKKVCKICLSQVCKKNIEKSLYSCPFCGYQKITTKSGISLHIKYCEQNPNRVPTPSKGTSMSEEAKQKISETRKKLIKEGKVFKWNVRRSKASYPEQWLMTILKENFGLEKDISYIKEFPFQGYYLDFAWPESKLCIEIDGEQHYKDEDQHQRDLRKDALLKEANWTEMRVSWQYIVQDKQKFLQKLKDFLENKIDNISEESKNFIEKKLSEQEKQKEAKEKLWKQRTDLIKNSGVDLTKYGHIQALVRETGLSRRVVYETLEKMK